LLLSKTFSGKKREQSSREQREREREREREALTLARERVLGTHHGFKAFSRLYNVKRAHSKREKKQNSGFLFIITHIVNNI